MHKKELALVFASIMFVLFIGFSVVSTYDKYYNDLDSIVELKTMKQLNQLLFSTPDTEEFVAYVTIENNAIMSFDLIGFKNIKTNEIRDLNTDAGATNATIHSHPSGSCIPSPRDFKSEESTICIICDINKVRCYEN